MRSFTIEEIPSLPTASMWRVGAYGPENFKLMAAMKDWASRKAQLNNGTIYGIAHDGPGTSPELCRYEVCLTVPTGCPADEAVQPGELPGGRYAVFPVPHTAEAVRAFWSSLFSTLEETGLTPAPAKPVLERYRACLVEKGLCEFCVPID